MASPEGRIAVGVTVLASVAMAVDHLMGDDPGLEDPPTFLISSALLLALAAFVFGFVVPRAKSAAEPAKRAARDGLICSVLAVVPGIAVLWLGLPFILAGGGLALGLISRREKSSPLAVAAIVIGILVLLLGTIAYAGEAIKKLG